MKIQRRNFWRLRDGSLFHPRVCMYAQSQGRPARYGHNTHLGQYQDDAICSYIDRLSAACLTPRKVLVLVYAQSALNQAASVTPVRDSIQTGFDDGAQPQFRLPQYHSADYRSEVAPSS